MILFFPPGMNDHKYNMSCILRNIHNINKPCLNVTHWNKYVCVYLKNNIPNYLYTLIILIFFNFYLLSLTFTICCDYGYQLIPIEKIKCIKTTDKMKLL